MQHQTTVHGPLVNQGHHNGQQGHRNVHHGHHQGHHNGQQGHRNVHHGHHQGHHNGQQVHRNVQHGHHKGHQQHGHRKPNATFGFYKAICFWGVLFGLAVLAQHVYKQHRSAPETPSSLYDGPHLSVNQYGPFEVWREQVDDVSLAVTKWLQEATTLHEHRRRATAILLKMEEGNQALIVLRAHVRSDNYPVWGDKLKELRRLVKLKPMPASPTATELETLVHKLVNGLLWLKREMLYV
jgi:hypothetical protein